MPTRSFSPKFVRASISFKYGDNVYELGEHLINERGVPGFSWTTFNPMACVGDKVRATIEVLTKDPFKLECDATLACEQTEFAAQLGLVFILAPHETQRIESAIAQEGILPDYVRKFPRISYAAWIPMLPSRTIVQFTINESDVWAVCDIDNLSPLGFQVTTEDQRVAPLAPGELLGVFIQPRGPNFDAIYFDGRIKRIVHGTDPVSGNPRWHFGLNIEAMNDAHRTAFTELLRMIVGKLRQ